VHSAYDTLGTIDRTTWQTCVHKSKKLKKWDKEKNTREKSFFLLFFFCSCFFRKKPAEDRGKPEVGNQKTFRFDFRESSAYLMSFYCKTRCKIHVWYIFFFPVFPRQSSPYKVKTLFSFFISHFLSFLDLRTQVCQVVRSMVPSVSNALCTWPKAPSHVGVTCSRPKRLLFKKTNSVERFISPT